MTNLVRIFPVPSGMVLNLVKMNPKRIMNTLLQTAIQRFIELKASATLEPISEAKNNMYNLHSHNLF